MTPGLPARPRLALAFTVIADGGAVHLIAGEDVRYTLRAGEFARATAALLARCDGRNCLTELLAGLPQDAQSIATKLIERLAGERVLVDGPVEAAHQASAYQAFVEGRGPLVARLRAPQEEATPGRPLSILCQESLDHHQALEFNRRARKSRNPWLWVTTGPASRGYVSPVFLPDAGPCLECLVRHFQRLSPVPQLYDALSRHGAAGGEFAAAEFPPPGLAILEQLVRWKLDQLSWPMPPAAVFRLHVLELATMEVSVHRALLDPTCPECACGTPSPSARGPG
jgi:bacteriocin biosynthesis cyclodehydratase domain-containing protein